MVMFLLLPKVVKTWQALSRSSKKTNYPECFVFLGSVYTKRQRQRCTNSAMMLAILFSLKSMETLENRLQPHSGASG